MATLHELNRVGADRDRVDMGTMLEAFETRSYGPFLLVPALLEISPIGGIPGVPTAIATVIVLFAVQIMAGRDTMWLPGFIRSRTIEAETMRNAVRKLRPVAGFMDRWFHGRLSWLTKGAFLKGAAAVCILLALTVPPLELLPFASTAPMAAIAAFGLAMTVRDGALMVVAYVLSILSFGIGAGLWMGWI